MADEQQDWYEDRNGVRFPSKQNPLRGKWDENYLKQLEDVFGGPGKELRSVKVPVKISTPYNMVHRPERRDLYRKMLRAGETLPPVIVQRLAQPEGAYRILDGSHRWDAASKEGVEYIDGYEVVPVEQVEKTEKDANWSIDDDVLVNVKTRTNKLRMARDHILEQGKTSLHHKQMPPGNWPRDPNNPGHVSVEAIQAEIDKRPVHRYMVTTGYYGKGPSDWIKPCPEDNCNFGTLSVNHTCSACDGSGTSKDESYCHYVDAKRYMNLNGSECAICEGVGKDIDGNQCFSCEGLGLGPLEVCRSCHNKDELKEDCETCGSTGVHVPIGHRGNCDHCGGTGSDIVRSKCPTCEGKGNVQYEPTRESLKSTQQHSNQESNAFLLGLTAEHLKQLESEGLLDVFRNMHDLSHYESHPGGDDHLGWVRFTGGDWDHENHRRNPIHVDEVQSDFGQKWAKDRSKHWDKVAEDNYPDSKARPANAEEEYAKKADELLVYHPVGTVSFPSLEGSSSHGSFGSTQFFPDLNPGVNKPGIDWIDADGNPHYYPSEKTHQPWTEQSLARVRAEMIEHLRSQDERPTLERMRILRAEIAQRYKDRENRDLPPEKRARIMEILFGGVHPNEMISEAFLQHFRDKGYTGDIHWPHPEFKAPISGLSPDKPLPVHFRFGYDELPSRLWGFKESLYGDDDFPTEDGPWRGLKMWRGKIRKAEAPYPEPASHIDLPDHILAAMHGVRDSFKDEMRKPRYRGDKHPTKGYCYVGAEALAHLIGAPRTGWQMRWVHHEGDTHHFLFHTKTKTVLDPTWDQFETPPDYSKGVAEGPLTGWDRPSKYAKSIIDNVRSNEEAAEEGEKDGEAVSPRLQKAIEELPEGKLVRQYPTGEHVYDYSEHLPIPARSKYQLLIRYKPQLKSLVAHVKPLDHSVPVGMWDGEIKMENGKPVLKTIDVCVKANHRSKENRLGTALYEAAMTHAVRHLGVKEEVGDVHSTSAHRTRERLADKHNLVYTAKPNYGSNSVDGSYNDFSEWINPRAISDYDGRYGPYRVRLAKNEGVVTSHIHQLPHQLEAEGYKLAINSNHIASVSKGGRLVGSVEGSGGGFKVNLQDTREGLEEAVKAVLSSHLNQSPHRDGWAEPEPERLSKGLVTLGTPTGRVQPKEAHQEAGGEVPGSKHTSPHQTYQQASQAKPKPPQGFKSPTQDQNLWVRQHPSGSNSNRVLMVQFSSDLLQGNRQRDDSDAYYDKLYANREGYDRPQDFWEIPQWQAHLAHSVPNADHLTVRNPEEAARMIKDAGYSHVAFSALDVNKDFIKQLAQAVPTQKIAVGGYTDMSHFAGLNNVKVHPDMRSFVEEFGLPYNPGHDYRHFQGTPTIPRLTLSDGCRHQCTFCCVPKKVEEKSTDEVMQQVESISKHLPTKLIYLNDKTFGQADNHKLLPQIYQKIKEKNPNFKGFVIQTTAAAMKNMTPDFLKAAGIRHVELGVETFNDPILRAHKKPASEKLLEEAAGKLRQAGVSLIPNIMVGLPGENQETYGRTLNWLDRHKDIISHVNAYNLALYQDSELGRNLEAKTDADRDENQAIKSWMVDPQVHRDFSDQLFRYGSQQLDNQLHKNLEKTETDASWTEGSDPSNPNEGEISFKLRTNKLRLGRDQILATGKPSIHYKQMPPGNWPRDPKNPSHCSAEHLQAEIDKQPSHVWNFSKGYYGEAEDGLGHQVCDTCGGDGITDRIVPKCKKCDGTGRTGLTLALAREYITDIGQKCGDCEFCGGDGNEHKECPDCEGGGEGCGECKEKGVVKVSGDDCDYCMGQCFSGLDRCRECRNAADRVDDCEACAGTGVNIPGNYINYCHHCHGDGTLEPINETCVDCEGSGMITGGTPNKDDLLPTQQHSAQESNVFRLDLHDRHLQQLRDEGLEEFFGNMYKASLGAGHPVSENSAAPTLGWVRFTGGNKVSANGERQPIHVDEVQSDYGQSWTKKAGSEARAKAIEEYPNEMILPDDVKAEYAKFAEEAVRDALMRTQQSLEGTFKPLYVDGGRVGGSMAFYPKMKDGIETIKAFYGDTRFSHPDGTVTSVPDATTHHPWTKEDIASLESQVVTSMMINDKRKPKAVIEEMRAKHAAGLQAQFDKEFPPEKLERVNQILFGQTHPNELIAEAFLQHFRNQGYTGDIHWPHPEFKAPISLGRPEDEPPVHFRFSYDELPKRLWGFKEAHYGDLPTQDGPWGRVKMWAGQVRKTEKDESWTQPFGEEEDENITFRLRTNKLRAARDHILEQGKTSVHHKEMPPGNWPRDSRNPGHVSVESIQAEIDKQPEETWRFSKGHWGKGESDYMKWCQHCHGKGHVPTTVMVPCSECNGTKRGNRPDLDSALEHVSTLPKDCETCHGTGSAGEADCHACVGTGSSEAKVCRRCFNEEPRVNRCLMCAQTGVALPAGLKGPCHICDGKGEFEEETSVTCPSCNGMRKVKGEVLPDDLLPTQQHSAQESNVFRLDFPMERMVQLKKEGLMELFQGLFNSRYNSGHPVNPVGSPKTAGWVRFTGGEWDEDKQEHKPIHVDEVQSDLGHEWTKRMESKAKQRALNMFPDDTILPDDPEADYAKKADLRMAHLMESGLKVGNCQPVISNGRRFSPKMLEGVHEYNDREGYVVYVDEKGNKYDVANEHTHHPWTEEDIANVRESLINREREYEERQPRENVERDREQHEKALRNDYNNQYPPEQLKRIQEILYGGTHPNELISEAFLQHLRNREFYGDIHWPHPEFKVPISGLDPKDPLPVHFRFSYDELPRRLWGFKEAKYGEFPTQDGPWKGRKMWRGKVRKANED
jgi:DnaJ-class molecular chaperone